MESHDYIEKFVQTAYRQMLNNPHLRTDFFQDATFPVQQIVKALLELDSNHPVEYILALGKMPLFRKNPHIRPHVPTARKIRTLYQATYTCREVDITMLAQCVFMHWHDLPPITKNHKVVPLQSPQKPHPIDQDPELDIARLGVALVRAAGLHITHQSPIAQIQETLEQSLRAIGVSEQTQKKHKCRLPQAIQNTLRKKYETPVDHFLKNLDTTPLADWVWNNRELFVRLIQEHEFICDKTLKTCLRTVAFAPPPETPAETSPKVLDASNHFLKNGSNDQETP